MILLIDNFDSFTYNLSQYLRMLGEEVVVMRNDTVSNQFVRERAPRLIVLSPGPKGPRDTGQCLPLLEAFYQEIPFLGICLGMQTIAHFFGGNIVKAGEPIHGKVRSVLHEGEGMFAGLKNPLQVTRYHSLLVEDASLPECLEVTARSEIGEIMAIEHRLYPLSGVQFHPEALLTEQGMDLLRNALSIEV